ncbi:hypothetical protein D3C87_1967160 [compost metagenome]
MRIRFGVFDWSKLPAAWQVKHDKCYVQFMTLVSFLRHRRAAALLARVVNATMVIELTGIRIAAITGDRWPVTANESPRIL